MKANQLYDTPIDVTLGRQPITLGDGLILADDDLGFTGIRVDARLPGTTSRRIFSRLRPLKTSARITVLIFTVLS